MHSATVGEAFSEGVRNLCVCVFVCVYARVCVCVVAYVLLQLEESRSPLRHSRTALCQIPSRHV